MSLWSARGSELKSLLNGQRKVVCVTTGVSGVMGKGKTLSLVCVILIVMRTLLIVRKS